MSWRERGPLLLTSYTYSRLLKRREARAECRTVSQPDALNS